MDQYINRLVTFTSWPDHVTVSTIVLAEAGFYSTKNKDEVQCFNCNVKIASWSNDDVPLVKHLHYSPVCSYATEKFKKLNSETKLQKSENVEQPTSTTINSNTTTSPVNITSTRGVIDILTKINSPLNIEESGHFEKRSYQTIDKSEIDYTIEINRLISFAGCWPDDSPVSIADLVATGMYYTGPGDRVQCAWCKGGLYNWEHGDTPLGEHKKHFPRCSFIQSKFSDNDQLSLKNLEIKKQLNENQNEASLPHSLPTPQSPITKKREGSSDKKKADWHDYPAVNIMEQMGYSTDIIEEAAQVILKKNGKFTTNEMMDVIFELESQQEKEEYMGTSSVENNTQLEGAVGYEVKLNPEHHNYNSKLSNQKESEIIHNNSVGDKAPLEEGAIGYEVEPNNSKFKEINSIYKVENQSTAENIQLLQMKEENSQLKSTTTCKICLDNTINILFLPCRHLVCCDDCGEAVKQCPLCRTVIIGTIKTFLS